MNNRWVTIRRSWCEGLLAEFGRVSTYALKVAEPHPNRNVPLQDPAFDWRLAVRRSKFSPALLAKGTRVSIFAWMMQDTSSFSTSTLRWHHRGLVLFGESCIETIRSGCSELL